MSARLGGFIAGQNINVLIGTVTFANTPDLTFASTAATPPVGTPVQFTTTGTLPTGFSLNTTYYVISVSSNTCQVSTTQGGSATTYTNGTGSGTHSAVTQRAFNPYAGAPNSVEYLVVAGGGGGGGGYPGVPGGTGGGGGAGGVLQGFLPVAVSSALTVTVGAGGTYTNWTSAGSAGNNGGSGSSSVFSSISTTGGGGGGGGNSAGLAGGSGGGAGGQSSTPGLGTADQGNSGASAVSYSGGGGGGAGSTGNLNVGENYRSAFGGTGICSTITGQRVFYGGGGGAHGNSNGDFVADGGAGGGGFSAPSSSNAGDGAANTGGGGGGGGNGATTANVSGAGGSGIVIIRYPQINSAPALVTGSPQVRYADGYQIYIWTSSGSIIF
jgi:hypothetical protein